MKQKFYLQKVNHITPPIKYNARNNYNAIFYSTCTSWFSLVQSNYFIFACIFICLTLILGVRDIGLTSVIFCHYEQLFMKIVFFLIDNLFFLIDNLRGTTLLILLLIIISAEQNLSASHRRNY